MEIRVLGCSGGADRNNRLTSFLINGTFAVDAGSLTNVLTFEEQRLITDVYISHIHMDHISNLPFLLDNIFGHQAEPLRIHAHAEVNRHLRDYIFNDICWPDFSILPDRRNPTVEYVDVPVGRTVKIADLQVTPVWVNHLVSNAGIIVTNEEGSWIYPSDTADTDEIWERTNALENPQLVFLECSFPNRLHKLAQESRHLTPDGVKRQLDKLHRQTATRIYHCKPSAIEEIDAELRAIRHSDLALLQQGSIHRI